MNPNTRKALGALADAGDAINRLEKVVERVQSRLHSGIGRSIIGEGRATRDLVCRTCGRREPINAEQAARYLAKGWPECCTFTMELESDQAPTTARKRRSK